MLAELTGAEIVSYYDRQSILLPDKFYSGKGFLEFHNDAVFLGA